MGLYQNMGGGSNSCAKLVAQMRNYLLQKEPYDIEYVENIDTAYTWWETCHQVENYIQKVALKILSIVPQNASSERVFSILGWFTNKRRTR
jgi:hypothetical protein